MKRGVIAIFLLLTTMVFSEDSQIDETRELRERVVKLETIIERMEKEEESSTNYYKEALQDSKEIYKGAVENNDKMLNHVYWAISGVFALLTAFLALIKWDNNKRLEKEKEEIKKDNERALKDLRTENKTLLAGVTLMQEEIKKLDEKLQKSFEKEIEGHREWVEKENSDLDKKIEKIDENLQKIDEQTKEIREKHMETFINSEISSALLNKKPEERLKALKKLEEKVKLYDEKVKTELYYALGICSRENENKIDYLTKVIELNPIDVRAYSKRAFEYEMNGEPERALSDYNKVIELNPEDSDGYHARARYYHHLEEDHKKEALENYEKAIELDRESTVSYDGIASIYLELGKKEKAVEMLIQHLKIDYDEEFCVVISEETYESFINYLDGKEEKTKLEKDVLRKFKELDRDFIY